MNRIVTMVLKNLGMVPGAWFKLCKYANHTDDYHEIEKYRHIQYILQHAVTGGNVLLPPRRSVFDFPRHVYPSLSRMVFVPRHNS